MKKVISLLLLAALLTSAAACGSDSGTNDTTSSDGTTDTSAPEETEPEEKLDLPSDLNYNGYVFRILSRPSPDIEQVYVEEQTGDVLADSVYKRNIAVEDKLGIKFEVAQSSSGWETDALNSILAGEDAYDAVATAARAAFVYAKSNAVMNWYDVDNLDLTKSWWSQDAAENLAINHKLYAMVGDITYATLGASVGMVFNKGLLDDYQLAYPYDLVDSGDWTFDVFADYAKNFS